MRKVLVLSIILLITSGSFAKSYTSLNTMQINTIALIEEGTKVNSFYFDNFLNLKIKNSHNIFGKCTIRVNITLEDGTKIKGKVTFHDVGFFECIGIKLANFWSKIF